LGAEDDVGQSHQQRQKAQQKKAAKAKVRSKSARQTSHQDRGRLEAETTAVRIVFDLLAGAPPLPKEFRGVVAAKTASAGPIWLSLILGLDAFLHDSKPWDLTLEQIMPLRRAFSRLDRDEAFCRVLVLSITNSPSAADPTIWRSLAMSDALEDLSGIELPAELEDDEAGTIAANFWCLSRGELAAKAHIQALTTEISFDLDLVSNKSKLKAFEAALKALRHLHLAAAEPHLSGIAHDLDVCEVFLSERKQHKHTAWYTGFVASLRHALASLGAHAERPNLGLGLRPCLLGAVYEHPFPELLATADGAASELRTVHFESRSEALLAFLEPKVVPAELDFPDRLRWTITKLRLQVAAAAAKIRGDVMPDRNHIAAAFVEAFALLEHGVPPQHKALVASVWQPMIELYVSSCLTLIIFKINLNLSLRLSRRNPRDFRLLALATVGALILDQERDLPPVQQGGLDHVDPEILYQCLNLFAGGKPKAILILRQRLFASLDKEQQKVCLARLLSAAVRGAKNPKGAGEQLLLWWPYLEEADFIFKDLASGAALEQDLVFYGCLAAFLQRKPLGLLSLTHLQAFLRQTSLLLGQDEQVGTLAAQLLLNEQKLWLTGTTDAPFRMRLVLTGLPPSACAMLHSSLAAYLACPGVRDLATAADLQVLDALLNKATKQTKQTRSRARARPKKTKEFADDLPF